MRGSYKRVGGGSHTPARSRAGVSRLPVELVGPMRAGMSLMVDNEPFCEPPAPFAHLSKPRILDVALGPPGDGRVAWGLINPLCREAFRVPGSPKTNPRGQIRYSNPHEPRRVKQQSFDLRQTETGQVSARSVQVRVIQNVRHQ